MTDAEKMLLSNQVEIMWTLHYIVGKQNHDLIGCNGELDRMRDDLVSKIRKTRNLID